MEWIDEGFILGTRRHGESSVIVELFTASRGRHLGLVRGGRSRRLQVVLQPGNGVRATWRARLDDHLGNYAMEPVRARAAALMERRDALYRFAVVAAHLRLLPERDPHPALYDRALTLLDGTPDPLGGAAALVRFEVALLADLGFGLDLSACAASGVTQELVWVSPRTGRAVSRTSGAPYAERLLSLPAFVLLDDDSVPPADEIAAGFALTGHFLARHAFEPRRMVPPPERERLVAGLRSPPAA